jgi:uncharacterized secreted protein with C-terminal beta-propeller domain
VTFDAAKPTERSTVAVTTSGNLAYSSTDHLYVATPVDQPIPVTEWDTRRPAPMPWAPAETEIHAFTLDGDKTTYVASGKVKGTVRDRWSFDEYDGNLRVATALTSERFETSDNAITVLHQDGDTLTPIGTVRGIGPREQIKSVRWFDDLAVVVTFRQVDPLYTVDLTDPAAPKVLGELKIPGFSSYLHPLGNDLLLGLGTSGQGGAGGQIATFDLADLTKPKQLDVLRIPEAELVASYDPHGFTFLPDGDKAFATLSSWKGYGQIVELSVAADGGLTEVRRWWSHTDTRIVPIDGDRIALVGRIVRIVDA